MTTEPETPNTDSPAPEQEQPIADTSTTDIQALKLGDEFDSALMGASIRGQFVYSLTELTIIAMNMRGISAEEAKQFTAQQVYAVTQMHGDAAPVFVDDWLLAEKTAEAAKLQEIAIPGQNHGAVKGFLSPNGVRAN